MSLSILSHNFNLQIFKTVVFKNRMRCKLISKMPFRKTHVISWTAGLRCIFCSKFNLGKLAATSSATSCNSRVIRNFSLDFFHVSFRCSKFWVSELYHHFQMIPSLLESAYTTCKSLVHLYLTHQMTFATSLLPYNISLITQNLIHILIVENRKSHNFFNWRSNLKYISNMAANCDNHEERLTNLSAKSL